MAERLEVPVRFQRPALGHFRPQKADAARSTDIDDSQNEFFVSRTSIWELSAKVAAGRLRMPGSTIQSLIDRIEGAGLSILELQDRYILRTETLPYHHSEPFDRILIAQTLEEGLTILSSDAKFPLYDAPVIWN